MPLNEQIVTGRSFRKCIDVTNKLWQKISFWSKASDVEFDDGENAETKLGAIKGITTDLNITETGYAADMTALAQLNSDIYNIFIIKLSPKTVTITSIGQEGVVYIPYPDIPEGYKPFFHTPASGTPNLLVANSQFNPTSQWGNGFPVRYIGYQVGNWPVQLYSYYIRLGR